jgi:hypothetical protein
MAVSYDVHLVLGSELGFKRSGVAINSVIPSMQTILDLEGNTYPSLGIDRPTKSLYVYPTSTFFIIPGYASNTQTVRLRNFGNSTVTMYSASFSEDGVTAIHNFTPGTTIQPYSSSTFSLSYFGETPGEYANTVLFESDTGGVYYRLDTVQRVAPDYYVLTDPETVDIDITKLGERNTTIIRIYSIVNNVPDYDTLINYTARIEGSGGWELVSTEGNEITVRFAAAEVSNLNGIHSASLILTVPDQPELGVPLTATVNIDPALNYHIANWISPASSYNSIVGVSYDVYDGDYTITIAVGMGGDGVPIYGEGGSLFTSLDSIGLAGIGLDIEYPYWSTVYRIPMPEPGTYLSGILDETDNYKYLVKTTEGLKYHDYFGYETGIDTMFIVDRDDAGNVTVEIDNLRELSGDVKFDQTMQNLTRAFHYHSTVDEPARYTQLEDPIIDGTLTHLFRGFTTSYNTGTSTWEWGVDLSIVSLPG